MIQRKCILTKTNSLFLFGPRGCGKTTFLQQRKEANTLFIDLLDIETYDEYLLEPARFRDFINTSENKDKKVIIDEVQRLPRLLDIVHLEIQKNKRIFILTGSSSRKLKQKGTNLLAGRAWIYHLYPFSFTELGKDFDLQKALERGGLPDAYLAQNIQDCKEYLNSYVSTYLQKEIQEEQWVKNLAPFRKFLAIAAQMNGKIINKSKIAKEIGINDVTVSNYFEILEDTLIGISLPAFHKSIRKAQRQAPKFYLIDTGIKRALDKTIIIPLTPRTSDYGNTFEHWVILECIKNSHYRRLEWSFSYLRTKDGLEIDLIIERPGLTTLLIEIKSKTKVTLDDIKSLELLGYDIDPKAQKILISNDPLERTIKNTKITHWKQFFLELFS